MTYTMDGAEISEGRRSPLRKSPPSQTTVTWAFVKFSTMCARELRRAATPLIDRPRYDLAVGWPGSMQLPPPRTR